MKYGNRSSRIRNLFKSWLLMISNLACFTTIKWTVVYVLLSGCLVYNQVFPTHCTLSLLAVLIYTGTLVSIFKFICFANLYGKTLWEVPVSQREVIFSDTWDVPGLSLMKTSGILGLSDF